MSETNRGGRPSTGTPILVRLPEALIARIDTLAEQRGTTRAATIRTLLEDAMTRTITIADLTSDLMAAGVDGDAITETPDGVVTVTATDGSRYAVAEDGQNEAGQQWWTGTRYGVDDEMEGTDSWPIPAEAVADVAAWWRRAN